MGKLQTKYAVWEGILDKAENVMLSHSLLVSLLASMTNLPLMHEIFLWSHYLQKIHHSPFWQLCLKHYVSLFIFKCLDSAMFSWHSRGFEAHASGILSFLRKMDTDFGTLNCDDVHAKAINPAEQDGRVTAISFMKAAELCWSERLFGWMQHTVGNNVEPTHTATTIAIGPGMKNMTLFWTLS